MNTYYRDITSLYSLFADIVLKIAYNIDVADENDVYIRLSEDALAAAAVALIPGKFVVEALPFLRHMPAWFPGSGKQKVFTKCQELFRTLEDTAYAHVKDAIVSSQFYSTCRVITLTFSTGGTRHIVFDSRSDYLGLRQLGKIRTSGGGSDG